MMSEASQELGYGLIYTFSPRVAQRKGVFIGTDTASRNLVYRNFIVTRSPRSRVGIKLYRFGEFTLVRDRIEASSFVEKELSEADVRSLDKLLRDRGL